MSILSNIEGSVLTLTLARPEKKNALTGDMYNALTAGLVQASGDTSILAVIIQGKDGVFCAGNDIGDFLRTALGAGADAMPAYTFIKALAAFDKPLIAAVDGPAVGIGTTLCLHCDLVYATAATKFHLPFVNLGLVPEAGSSLLLPLRVGTARAAELLMLAEPFDAARAHAMGLVNEVVAADKLYDHAKAKAAAVAAKPRTALLATRKFIHGDKAVVLKRIDDEVAEFRKALASPEAAAAFQAFMARPKA